MLFPGQSRIKSNRIKTVISVLFAWILIRLLIFVHSVWNQEGALFRRPENMVPICLSVWWLKSFDQVYVKRENAQKKHWNPKRKTLCFMPKQWKHSEEVQRNCQHVRVSNLIVLIRLCLLSDLVGIWWVAKNLIVVISAESKCMFNFQLKITYVNFFDSIFINNYFVLLNYDYFNNVRL